MGTEVRGRLSAALAPLYEIERELGAGGMATVYLARDLRHGRRVALKVLRPELASTLGPDRFEREIAVAATLSHPNILPLHDSGEADGLLYYSMPYVEGESLRDRLDRETQLPVAEAIRIARLVAQGLGYAHSRGIVHRDIKPENILLSEDAVVVTDFGIARAFGTEEAVRLTNTGMAVGTPAYMSPEQVAGDRELDGRSDLYALGCVLYEMLMGEPPFTGPTAQVIMARHSVERVPTMHAIRTTIPLHVEDAVRTALAKTPADRYRTADQFIAALDGTAAARTLIERRVTAWWRRPRARGWALGAAGAAVVALGALLVVPRLGVDPAGGAALDPSLVAVMPFRVTGADDPATSGLSEAVPELLYVRLPGDVGPRAVYPATVAAALVRDGITGELSLEQATGVAARLGAGRVLLGQILASGGQLVLSASLHGVPGGAPIARTQDIRGPSDSLLPMVDRLTAEVLSRGAGETEQRLSELVTTDLGALRAYLAGKSAFDRGQFAEAARHYRAAVEVDSTFALAAVGMATAAALVRGAADLDRGRALAWAARDQLGSRDRMYLTALAGPRYPAQSSARERLAAWEAAVAVQDDRAEVWYQLGEELLHSGPWLGITGLEQRAAAAFRRALALDSTFAPAIAHLLDVAARQGDTAAVRRLRARYLAIDSVGAHADFYRWRSAVALGETNVLERMRREFGTLSTAALEHIIAISQLDGTGMTDAVAAAEALREKSVSGRDARWAHVKLQEIALNRGRPREAATTLQAFRAGRPTTAFDALSDVVEALHWGADSAHAARVVAERAPSADAPVRAGTPADAPQYFDICAVNLWRLARGERRTAPSAIAALRRVPNPLDEFRTGFIEVCAAVLEARLAAALGRADLPTLLNRLDSLAQSGPPSTSWLLVAANLTVADLRERQGDLAAALAATRRRASRYDLGEPRVLVGLATFLREEGRLAALAGDRAGAIAAYTHYLALRDAPEPGVAGEVAAVRAALAALEGPGGSGAR